ncbi:helix-turn-helix domain-containing protein [Mycobacterium sp. Y57]|uniref:helix-turn-helix domain-containing protein n=1 Tax=Mycolicibacterium xanthum TaxID=2796469 RepID=UPI001C84D9A6|nr:helix-turn-helix domain-containing protein [Mycolicibacterium xanthum]MBX7434576.1 helix-turn-helix domain-containing protein [Mycolicibacterium xanthum]
MSKSKAQPRLAGIPVAAKNADVHPRTLRRWISEGRLTGYRVGPRLIKVDLNELEAFIQPVGGAA